jgi:hypothetical protein
VPDPKVLRNTNSVMEGKGGVRLDMWEGTMWQDMSKLVFSY